MANTEKVEVERAEEDQEPCCCRLSSFVYAACDEGAMNTKPGAVDVVATVSHGTHQQMAQEHLHKQAGIDGHNHSQRDFFGQGGCHELKS